MVKVQSKETAQKYVSDNFKEDEGKFEIEEEDVQFLVKDWELPIGSKVKPYQPINICDVVKEVAPLPKIEKTCKENVGHGTLACFAKRKKKDNECFALTAQHILSMKNYEKKQRRYIFSEVSKQGEEREQCRNTIMLSTRSSGLLDVEYICRKDIYLDIAMMQLSKSLVYEHQIQIAEKLHVEMVHKDEKVFKIGTTTGQTTGTVTKVWTHIRNEFSNKFGLVFCVKSDSKETPFARPGDSGSLVYSMRGGKKCALGIIARGPTDKKGSLDGEFYCVHLEFCMKAIRKKLGKKLELELYDEAMSEKSSTSGVSLLSHEDVYEHCTYQNNSA